jgi:hypothetical protein
VNKAIAQAVMDAVQAIVDALDASVLEQQQLVVNFTGMTREELQADGWGEYFGNDEAGRMVPFFGRIIPGAPGPVNHVAALDMMFFEILLGLYRGGQLLEQWEPFVFPHPSKAYWELHHIGGRVERLKPVPIEAMIVKGLLKRNQRGTPCANITDEGLQFIGKPTKAQLLKVEVKNPPEPKRKRGVKK